MTSTFFVNRYLTAICFCGADAALFLQGQISVDVDAMQVLQWRRAAYCSPKGRIIATMLLVRKSADEFIAIVPTNCADDVITRLSRFVLRAKVRIYKYPSAVQSYCHADDLSATPQSYHRGECQITNHEEGDYLCVDENDNWQLRLQIDSAHVENNSESDKDSEIWRRGQIMRGVPWIDATASEQFVPQYVNWDLLDGVDFQKGCYVGQEIVARLHYLGNVKRRVYLAHSNSVNNGSHFNAGDKSTDGGEVVNAAVVDGGLWALLSAARDIPSTTDLQGTTLHINEPPYSLPSAAEDNKPRPKV